MRSKTPLAMMELLVMLLVFGLVLLVAVLFFWWKKHKEQEALKDKHTEEMLKTPIETFGDTEAEELAKKYQQSEDVSQAQVTDSAGAGESKE